MKLSAIKSPNSDNEHKTTYYYDLYHKGLKAKRHAAFFEAKNNELIAFYVSNYNDLDIDTTVILRPHDAIKAAIEYYRPFLQEGEFFMWESPYNNFLKERLKKINSDKENSSFYPQSTEKEIIDIDGIMHFAYSVPLSIYPSRQVVRIYLNPKNGVLIHQKFSGSKCNGGMTCGACGGNNTSVKELDVLYYPQVNTGTIIDPVPLGTAYTNQNPKPSDASFPMNRKVCSPTYCQFSHNFLNYRLDLLASYSAPFDTRCYNQNTNNQDCIANTAYWGAKQIYDYFNTTHSWQSWDDNNSPIAVELSSNHDESAKTVQSYIDDIPQFAPIFNNLGITPNYWMMTVGRGNTGTNQKPRVTLDILGHEFIHGINEAPTSPHLYNNGGYSEQGIILESFCDIFGIVIEGKYIKNDWAVFNDDGSVEVRSLKDPKNASNSINAVPVAYGKQPSYYEGQNWLSSTGLPANDINWQLAYTHHNNGVMNYWFYLLSEGTNGNGTTYTNEKNKSYKFNGLGIETAAKIAFLTLTDELSKPIYPNKNFQDVRKATLAVAKRQPWGICSKEWETVRKAWDAVGVTGCDWDIDLTTQCNGKNCIVEVEVCGTDVKPLIKIKQGANLIKKKKTYKLTHTINNGCNKNYKIEIVDKSNSSCEPPSKDFTCDDSGNPIGISPCEDLIYTNLVASGTSAKYCTTGGILLSVSGGIAPYSFQWSNGSTSQNLMNVAPGTYSVTITDACSDEPLVKQFTVVSLPTINTAVNITKTCISTSDGAIDLTVSNAKQPYSYNWSNGATTEDISNLPVGTYTVTITDGNECQKVESFTVNHFPDMQLTFSSFEDECQGQQDGMIDLSVQSGTAPYTYQWSNGSTSQDLDNLSTGTYSVTCTDFHGCQKTASITLNSITPTVQVLSESCQEVYYCKGEIIGNSASLWQFVTEDCSSCQTVEYCSLTNSYRYLPGLPYTYDYFDSWTNACYEVTECTFISGNVCTSSIVPQGITTNYIPQPNGCPYGQTLVQDYCGNTLIYQTCVVMARISDDSSNVINGTINAYPNPFNSSFNLSFETTGNSVNILIHNLTGQKIYENVVGTQEGTNDLNIAIQEQIADGVYLVSVIHEDGSKEVLKVVKQNN